MCIFESILLLHIDLKDNGYEDLAKQLSNRFESYGKAVKINYTSKESRKTGKKDL